MTVSTIFLRSPAGVAIRTNYRVLDTDLYDIDGLLQVTNERGKTLLIPVDNIASVELEPA